MPSFTVFKGSKDGSIKKSTTTKPDDLTGDQVLIKVTASGLCGTGEYPLDWVGDLTCRFTLQES